MNLKETIVSHQQKIVLVVGYLLVAGAAFGLGRFTYSQPSVPEIKVEEALVAPNNYTSNTAGLQSGTSTTTTSNAKLDCAGKIKGASSLIYHLPGDAFYERTTKPIRCFDTEAQAQAAGFKKSSK